MKTCKRMLAVLLIITAIASMMALPASAAGQLVQDACADFPTVYYSNTYSLYHVALQRFLQAYSDECEALLGNNGVDGYFGSGSTSALKRFQKDNSLQQDGRAGPMTRSAIGQLLEEKNVTSGYREIWISGEKIGLLLDESGSPSSALYNLRSGLQEYFHFW